MKLFILIYVFLILACGCSNNASEGKALINTYFKDGVLLSQKEVIIKDCDTILNGRFIVYHNNGQIAAQAFYRNNIKEGCVTMYNEHGKLIQKAFAYKDKIIGDDYHYYENGLDSIYRLRDFEGHIQYERKYNDMGFIVNERGNPFPQYALSYSDDSIRMNIIKSNLNGLYTNVVVRNYQKQNYITSNKIQFSGAMGSLCFNKRYSDSVELHIEVLDSLKKQNISYDLPVKF